MKFLVALSILVLFPGVLVCGSTNEDRVLLLNVTAITLYEGKNTTGRRNPPITQLYYLKGGDNCKKPNVVRCLNQGSDGVDAQWVCNATLDKECKFGYFRVDCEGYESPEDPYILKGSCGLKYELEYTESHPNYNHGSNGWSEYVTLILIFGILFLILVILCMLRDFIRSVMAPFGSHVNMGANTETSDGLRFWNEHPHEYSESSRLRSRTPFEHTGGNSGSEDPSSYNAAGYGETSRR